MADEPENHTLRLLREMREETHAGFEEMRSGFKEIREEMRSGFEEVRSEFKNVYGRLDLLDIAVAAVSADLKMTKEKVESIDDRLETIEGRMNSVERRLGRIETHTGMVKA